MAVAAMYAPARKKNANPFDLGYLFAPKDVEIWPENWSAVQLFMAVRTQWRVGFGGPVGLDYNVLFTRMDHLELAGEEREAMFDAIRYMEEEALGFMNTDT